MTFIRQSWQQPDRYEWLSGYLAERGLQRFTQVAIGTFAGVFGLVPLVMLRSASGPHDRAGAAAAMMIAILCAAMAVLWLSRWPTQHQSELFTVSCNLGVTVGCIVAGSPITGLLACTTFAPIAGYVTLFHSSRLLMLTLVNAGLTTVFAAVRVAMAGDAALAFAHFLGVAVAVLAVPFAGQVLLHLLMVDAMVSHIDPLTGLHNRRGFYRSAAALLQKDADEHRYFTVLMVDLDGFKMFNDHHGHAIGDEILTAVADNLRRTSRLNSVVARVGGEEFLIAELSDADATRDAAEQMLRAIGAVPWNVTASIGAAMLPLTNGSPQPAQPLIDHLIAAADAAMYEAKRAGGNQIRIRSANLAP